MGYLFVSASSQYLEVTISTFSYPSTIGCWLYCTSNSADNGYALSVVDKASAQHHAGIYAFSDGLVYLTAKGATANDGSGCAAAYSSATWTPVIAVLHSAIDRDVYVGANTDNSTVDTGAFSGITTCIVGAAWDNVPSAAENLFDGRVAAPFVDIGAEWDSTARAAYIAGTEGHKITGITPNLYKDLIRNASSPADFGTAFTLNGAPTLTDHPPLLTGQNKKQLTLTGDHFGLAATIQTLMYAPDPGRTGADTLTIKTTDATALSDTDNVSLTVAAAPPGANWSQWELVPANPIVYEHPAIDIGAIVTFTPQVTFSGQGTPTITEAHSDDDISYSSFAAISGEVTARYIKIKVSLADSFARFDDLDITISVELIRETINDVDTSTLTGSTGARRLALVRSYSLIKSVLPILQDVGAGWSVTVADKNPSLGPLVKIYNASDTLTDTTMDFVIEGIAST